MNKDGDKLTPIDEGVLAKIFKEGKGVTHDDLKKQGLYPPLFSVGELVVLKGVQWEIEAIDENSLTLKPVSRAPNRKERRRAHKLK